MTTTSYVEPTDIEVGANHAYYGNLTGASQSFTVTTIQWGDHPRSHLYGFQIVQIPEPATGRLLGLAGLLLLAARRRR